MEVKPLDVGIIGVGSMGRTMSVFTQSLKVWERSTFTIQSEKTPNGSGISPCPATERKTSWDKAEAVSICVPTKYHFETAKKVLHKGISCLIEKPITLTVSEGDKFLRS